MAVFDNNITNVSKYIDKIKTGNSHVREIHISPNPSSVSSQLPKDLDRTNVTTIVLKSDTFLELGNPSSGSSSFSLYTDSPDIIRDGRITLIGPDVGESEASQLPFAQVIIVGGKQLTDNDFYHLLQFQGITSQIEGYMVKSTQENIWSRISNDAARKGFNFEKLGSSIILSIKHEMPKVEYAEVLFVTSSKEDVTELDKIGISAREIARNIKEKIWKDRGVDILACKPGGHCGSCDDKEVCDDIRKIATERVKLK